MNRRIVHARADARRVQLRHHLAALDRQPLFREHDLKHVPVALREIGDRQLQPERTHRRCREQLEVDARQLAAFCIERIEVR